MGSTFWITVNTTQQDILLVCSYAENWMRCFSLHEQLVERVEKIWELNDRSNSSFVLIQAVVDRFESMEQHYCWDFIYWHLGTRINLPCVWIMYAMSVTICRRYCLLMAHIRGGIWISVLILMLYVCISCMHVLNCFRAHESFMSLKMKWMVMRMKVHIHFTSPFIWLARIIFKFPALDRPHSNRLNQKCLSLSPFGRTVQTVYFINYYIFENYVDYQ